MGRMAHRLAMSESQSRLAWPSGPVAHRPKADKTFVATGMGEPPVRPSVVATPLVSTAWVT
jgi:hypothetical protein